MKELITDVQSQRLDKYIAEKENISRVMAQRLIEEGNILVNRQESKPSYQVQAGDEIYIQIPEVKTTDLKAQEIPLDIIYEDNDIIVVNKAKGMVVHPAVRKSGWYFGQCRFGTLRGEFVRHWWRIKTWHST